MTTVVKGGVEIPIDTLYNILQLKRPLMYYITHHYNPNMQVWIGSIMKTKHDTQNLETTIHFESGEVFQSSSVTERTRPIEDPFQ